MNKMIAKWEGEQADFEIALWESFSGRQLVSLIASENAEDEEAESDEVAMSRADLLGIIAGLQNALAELDTIG